MCGLWGSMNCLCFHSAVKRFYCFFVFLYWYIVTLYLAPVILALSRNMPDGYCIRHWLKGCLDDCFQLMFPIKLHLSNLLSFVFCLLTNVFFFFFCFCTAQSHLPAHHDVQNDETLYIAETWFQPAGEHQVSLIVFPMIFQLMWSQSVPPHTKR